MKKLISRVTMFQHRSRFLINLPQAIYLLATVLVAMVCPKNADSKLIPRCSPISPSQNLVGQDQNAAQEPAVEESKKEGGTSEEGKELATEEKKEAEPEFDEYKLRLEKLEEMTFDRSHAAVLAAWAAEKLPPEPEDKKDEDELAEAEAKKAEEQKAEGGSEAGKKEDEKPDPKKLEVEQKTKAIEEEVKQFGRWVTLGRWEEIARYIVSLKEPDQRKIYLKLLTGLAGPPPGERPSGIPETALPMQALSADDVIAIADASPVRLSDRHLSILSQMLKKSKESGFVLKQIKAKLNSGTRRLGGSEMLLRNAAAQLLLDAEEPDAAADFLPEWPNTELDGFGLKLLAKYFDGKYAREPKQEWLQKSWEVHQSLLARTDLKKNDRIAALRRTVEISTLIDKQLGKSWLNSSFSQDKERGIRILSQIGAAASTELVANFGDPRKRFQLLKLQNKAVEALLQSQGEEDQPDSEWKNTLTLLADQWNREAEISEKYGNTSSYYGSNMQYDRYGNFYYREDDDDNDNNRYQGNAIDARDLLEVQPSDSWKKQIVADLQPRISMVQAKLQLKLGEEKKAFPLIEQLAADQPEIARELVHEFLRTWTSNHDPNQQRRQYNPYMYIYGYNSNAEAIPLSRSRQEKNLEELSQWVSRIRKLPIESIDESLLAAAFTTCHSSAEVFQIEAFVEVFGEIQSLKPETIAILAETMRGNLASVWRQMKVQENAKTKRKEHEVLEEVLRGYQVALEIVGSARQKHDQDWKLQLAEATLLFDLNSYMQGVRPSTEFLEIRDQAFQLFQQAAELYKKEVGSIDFLKQSTDVYDNWFYAALGSTDLGQISHLNTPDQKQFPLIQKAIDDLPGETAESHMAKFANKLFTRLSAVQPQSKYRFLKAGFEIVEDHPLAWEAKKTFDYYNDTTNEIKLIAELDGPAEVGSQKSFGVFVKLLHTNEMERESGGFQKYVQNQTQSPFMYNYGRPQEDYREKFEEGVAQSLKENFEILSVTFENPKNMRSRKTEHDGWRETPFAYLMLKTRGPQIDRLPALTLNLDFMDSAGFVVLPIESPPLVLDASSSEPPPRPYQNLSIVQTLDERNAAEGKLILDIRASANGLVPELNEILDMDFGDLEVRRIDDQSSSPTGFDPVAQEISIQSDRSWLIELGAAPGKKISEFKFCSATSEEVEMKRQQYRDADLVAAEPTIVMGTQIERVDWKGMVPWIAAGVLGAFGLLILGVSFFTRPVQTREKQFEMPAEVNPFTVLGLLERIQREGSLKENVQAELVSSIREVQKHFFAPQNGQQVGPLEEIAKNWLRRVR